MDSADRAEEAQAEAPRARVVPAAAQEPFQVAVDSAVSEEVAGRVVP